MTRLCEAASRTLLVVFIATASVIIFIADARTATLGDDGLHKQNWFHHSFLDLKADLNEAHGLGKGLLIAFEQAGCPYCRELHRVNLAAPEIVAYLRKHFLFVQLDLRGAREVTDFDGKVLPERKLARRWGIVFTPTLILFEPTAQPAAKPGNLLASAVMPGYFKPFHFRTMLEFVAAGHHKNKHFQQFIDERAKLLRSQGKKVSIW